MGRVVPKIVYGIYKNSMVVKDYDLVLDLPRQDGVEVDVFVFSHKTKTVLPKVSLEVPVPDVP